MCFWIKCDGLVTRIVAGHVTFAAINAHFFIDNCNCLLFVIQLTVRTNCAQGTSYHILKEKRKFLNTQKEDSFTQAVKPIRVSYDVTNFNWGQLQNTAIRVYLIFIVCVGSCLVEKMCNFVSFVHSNIVKVDPHLD